MSGENLRRLLRARLEEELAEAHRYFGDSLDRPLVIGPRQPDGELPPMGTAVDLGAWPKELPWPLLAGQALALVEQGTEILVAAVAEELSTCARILVEPDLLEAVLSRPEVARQWPGPGGRLGPERDTWATLLAWHHLGRARGFLPGEGPAGLPPGVAPGPVVRWAQERLDRCAGRLPAPQGQRIRELAAEMVQNAESERGVRGLSWTGPDGRRLACPAAGMALLYQAEQEVKEGLQRRTIALDAGKPHHDLLVGWRNLPKDPRYKMERPQIDGRIELLEPGQAVQLSLPLEDEGIHAAAIHALRKLRGYEGLRHWAVLQRLFSLEGGRRGWVRWMLDDHLKALGYRDRACRDPQTRARVVGQVEMLTRLELSVYSRDNTLWHRRPLLLVGGRFGRIEGAESRLEGLELQINPLLYEGVRDPQTGELGSNWFPAPAELARIDHTKHPYALPLGLLLPIRWRWDLWDGRDHLALTGQKLLALAGIPFKKYDPGRAWKALDRDLAELVRIGLLDRWQWGPGTEHTEKGICRLYPAQWLLDRTVRGLLPQESPPVNLPQTGAELRAWRKALDWSQQRMAQELGVSEDTIYRAEVRKKSPLSQALQGALKRAQDRLPGLAPDKPKADPGWWK